MAFEILRNCCTTVSDIEFFLAANVLGSYLYMIPSLSTTNKTHLVDMLVGRCQCLVGFDGSSSLHHYFLWSNNFADSVNFFPCFNKKERKKFVEFAYVSSLPLQFYENLHPSEKGSQTLKL